MIRVLLADDQALVRAGFRALLDAQEDIEVVGEAVDGEEAVRLARDHAPDVVLMDIRMPGMDGLEATRIIVADPALNAVRIVILTTFDLDEYVFEALRVGASGFLVKNTEPAELVHAVRAVAAGDALLSPGVTKRLVMEFAARSRQPRPTAELDALTDREREVMALVAEGLSNAEIAERLVVSPATAKNSRQPRDGQARCQGSSADGRARLRIRPGTTRLALEIYCSGGTRHQAFCAARSTSRAAPQATTSHPRLATI